MSEHTAENDVIRVGFRYRDGEVLSPEREALSEDDELPVAVLDLGDGEWLTLADLRAMHAERLERDLAPVQSVGCSQCDAEPGAPCVGPGTGWHLSRWDRLHEGGGAQ